jgi:ABC-type multidrug transport system fused ATPase/permease subunit
MNKEEFEILNNIIERSGQRSDKIEQIFLDMRSRNLEHLRNFWLNLIVLSSAIIVGILSLVFKEDMSSSLLLIIMVGVSFFILMDIVGVYFLNHKLSKENHDLDKLHNFNLQAIKDERRVINNYLNKQESFEKFSKEYADFLNDVARKEEEIRKSNVEKNKIFSFLDKYISDILAGLFILGILCILASFIIYTFIN